MLFYEGKRKHEKKKRKYKPRILDHTVASNRYQWNNRHEPSLNNDLLLSHDHQPMSGGKLNVWNKINISDGITPIVTPHSHYVKSPRYTESIRKGTRKSTVNNISKRRARNDQTRNDDVDIQYVNTDSSRAAKSIVRERAERDGIFGNSINVGFVVT